MVKNREINGTEEIALVTPTPGQVILNTIVFCGMQFLVHAIISTAF